MSSGQCAVCWKEGGSPCSTCKSCHYCSEECQKSDWKSHKLLCHLIATETERPSPSHIRAIYFPDSKPTPELVWIPCIENDEIPEEPNVPASEPIDDLLGNKFCVHVRRVDWDDGGKKSTPRPIEVYHRDNFLLDESPPTASLEAAVRHYGQEKVGWRGPLVVVAVSVEDGPHEDPINRYVDATLADFRSIIHYSLHYKDKFEEVEKKEEIVPGIIALTRAMGSGMVFSHDNLPGPSRRRE
ncbi:hypothetical protein F5Y06DRAFT_163077 [Hypoxylon sp. FL0890]|nr:hypothetical protein F5Y06DRAFT_163077 [Hypoxylon sp. FL0890]